MILTAHALRRRRARIHRLPATRGLIRMSSTTTDTTTTTTIRREPSPCAHPVHPLRPGERTRARRAPPPCGGTRRGARARRRHHLQPGRRHHPRGLLGQVFPIDLPHVPGIDLSGTVVAVGEGVSADVVGRDVVAFPPMTGPAASAQRRHGAGRVAVLRAPDVLHLRMPRRWPRVGSPPGRRSLSRPTFTPGSSAFR